MATLADCEKHVIKALISVFSKTLNNCSLPENNESEVTVVEKVLQVLLAQNESLYSDGDGNNNGRGIMMSILEDHEFMSNGENTTNVITAFVDGGNAAFPGGVGTSNDKSGSKEINRLHQLEIIKVFVLIFVISIILLTSCRMIFQLFIKFPPVEKKPPFA